MKQGMKKAFKLIGKTALAKHLGVRYQSIDQWIVAGKMPLSEYSGDTMYSTTIQRVTKGKVTVTDLLGFVPHPQDPDWPEYKYEY